jgi:hypothetical protein
VNLIAKQPRQLLSPLFDGGREILILFSVMARSNWAGGF